MTSDQFLSLVRAGLNLGGGILVTTGAIKGADMTTIAGVVLPLASMIWGWTVHDPVAVVQKAETLKAKGVV